MQVDPLQWYHQAYSTPLSTLSAAAINVEGMPQYLKANEPSVKREGRIPKTKEKVMSCHIISSQAYPGLIERQTIFF